MHKSFFATQLGCMVSEAFSANREGKVMGISSKGIFLRSGDYILFITEAPYKSPFNLYVPGFDRLMSTLAMNEQFEVTQDGIHFTDSDTRIVTENADVWTPKPPLAITTEQAERQQQAAVLLDQIAGIDAKKGWIFLHTEKGKAVDSTDYAMTRIVDNTRNFMTGFQQNALQRCLEASASLFGLGGGLTPSGDDWLTGFLLYQTRYHQAENTPSGFLDELSALLQDMAFQKTTTISANRIMAARRGWAEEPFLAVIDTLFESGKAFPQGLTELLVRFGHSSGVDTTLGIAAAVECE